MEHRAVHAGAHHPGDAVLTHHGQHACHADPDPAGHGLLHQGQHRDVVTAGERGHLAEHPHRAACVDDVRPRLVDRLREAVGDQPPHPHRTVLGGDHRGARGPAGGHRAEDPVRARRAEQEVHLAAAAAEPVGQREERGAAVAAAHQQAAHRVARDGERPPERPGHVEHVPGAALGQPAGPRAHHGEHKFHGAAVVGPHIVDGERAAQQHGGFRAAHGDRDELAGPESRRDPRRDHRHRMVGIHLAHGEHGAAHLHLHRVRPKLAVPGGHGAGLVL